MPARHRLDRLPRLALHAPLVSARSLLGLALLLLCVGCQTTAFKTRPVDSDDIDRSVTLPCTLANVWYRPQNNPEFKIPFTETGSLAVTADRALFTYESGSLTIPVSAITNVSWRKMVGDLQNEWAVVTWMENGAERVAGFTAANGYRYETSNKQLYSALCVAWQPQPTR